jgi:4a-hydroxytetrahydrobiopterin dehydratase
MIAKYSGAVHQSLGESIMSVKNEPALAAPEVEAFLAKNLPAWKLEDGWIRRTYKTNSWKGTMMAVNTVGHLAEAAWHHPDITLSYAWLEVRLMTHSAKGITRKDLELAQKIEEVVMWQPASNPESALDGTPATDLRFAYMKYE